MSSQDGVPAAELSAGTLVNGLYRLVRVLGVGGMGEVWEARHERTKGRVALKLLLPEMGRYQEVLQRFQREAEITSGLNHPNIVRVTDFDKLPNGRPFLAMEFLEGHDLSSVAQLRQPLSLAEAVEIIEQTATGLQAAHSHQIIHRDLKPANVFLVPLPGTSRVIIKILDFGISKALDGIDKLTQTRNVMGTPNYMAPEQATKGAAALDARADQFSLAAIAYELLTGCMAFDGDGMMNVLFKVVHEPPPSFASLGVAAAPGIEAAVMRGLSKSAGDRFASVVEFSDELKRAAGGIAAVATAPGGPAAAAQTAAVRTLIIPTAIAPTPTTLRGSLGQVGAATEEVTPTRRKPAGALIGGAVLAVAAIAIVAVFGMRGAPKVVAVVPVEPAAQPGRAEPPITPIVPVAPVTSAAPAVSPVPAVRTVALPVRQEAPEAAKFAPPPSLSPRPRLPRAPEPPAAPAAPVGGGEHAHKKSKVTTAPPSDGHHVSPPASSSAKPATTPKPAAVKPVQRAGPVNEDL